MEKIKKAVKWVGRQVAAVALIVVLVALLCAGMFVLCLAGEAAKSDASWPLLAAFTVSAVMFTIGDMMAMTRICTLLNRL